MQIRFDTGPDGAAGLFDRPERLIMANEAFEVPAALEEVSAAQARGQWLAGFASYELGFALEPRLMPLMPVRRRLPLLMPRPFRPLVPLLPGPAVPFQRPAGAGAWSAPRR